MAQAERDSRPLIEGVDYVVDADGLFVFTRRYLLLRGACCGSGCRNCPWGEADDEPPCPDEDLPPEELN